MRKQIRQSDIFELIATGYVRLIPGMTYRATSIVNQLEVTFVGEQFISYFAIDTKEHRRQAIKLINKRLKEIHNV